MCEYPDVYSEIKPVARKIHYCCECLLPIPKGEQYSHFKGCWAGGWNHYKSHMECRNWSLEVMKSAGDCIPFGYLIEDHSFDREHHQDLRSRYAKILRKYRGVLAERKQSWKRTWHAARYLHRKQMELKQNEI